jgi:branched-chain amino acid transport system substrate-binding protein
VNIFTTAGRRRHGLVATLTALALVVSACGGDDDDDAADTASAAPETTEAEASETGAADTTSAPATTTAGADTTVAASEPSSETSATEPPADLSVPDSPDDGVTSDAIKIGWMGDLTGPTASAQSFNMHGTQAYFDCLNADGGVLGRQIEFIPEDDQYAAEKATVNYTKLVQDDKVLALTDMGGSHISTQLSPRVEEDGIAVLGMGQTIDAQLTEGGHFFNTIAHYGDEADGAWTQIVTELGDASSAVVAGISLEAPSGQEWAAYMEKTVTDGGGRYIDTVYVAPTATEATAQVTQLKDWIDNEGVNYLSLHGSPNSALVVLQSMADAGIVLPVVGIHGIASNSLWEQGPAEQTAVTVGMHSFLPANNDIPAAAEMTRCAAESGYAGDELTINYANGFAVGMIVHQAILEAAKSGELTRASFTDALRAQVWDTEGITCPVDWTSSQHSPCVAAFTYDPESKGMVALQPFDVYADSIDAEYGITAG